MENVNEHDVGLGARVQQRLRDRERTMDGAMSPSQVPPMTMGTERPGTGMGSGSPGYRPMIPDRPRRPIPIGRPPITSPDDGRPLPGDSDRYKPAPPMSPPEKFNYRDTDEYKDAQMDFQDASDALMSQFRDTRDADNKSEQRRIKNQMDQLNRRYREQQRRAERDYVRREDRKEEAPVTSVRPEPPPGSVTDRPYQIPRGGEIPRQAFRRAIQRQGVQPRQGFRRGIRKQGVQPTMKNSRDTQRDQGGYITSSYHFKSPSELVTMLREQKN